MPKFNDFDLTGENWKKYEDIFIESLWIINERDKSGKHSNFYHGNFIPQIPNQLIRRFTKKGDFVLDLFLGSATTAIECENLERNIIGIDLQENLIHRAKELITSEKIHKHFGIGDSSSVEIKNDIQKILNFYNKNGVELILLHPPYFDIVKFSENKKDLSNCENLEKFLESFKKVLESSYELLKKDGYLAIIIGDKYQKGELIPLGFYCMNEAQNNLFKLKSIIVKNIEGNRGKFGNSSIWKYRALKSDYYIFKHEYILIFKK